MIKETYKGNAEAKILEVSDMISNIKRSIHNKQMNESKLLELLETMEKDLKQSLFFMSLW
jgi:hypothetical protein